MEQDAIGERAWQGCRLVIAHDPCKADEQHRRRQQSIDELLRQAEQWTGRLDAQDEGGHLGGASSPIAAPRRVSIMRCARFGGHSGYRFRVRNRSPFFGRRFDNCID